MADLAAVFVNVCHCFILTHGISLHLSIIKNIPLSHIMVMGGNKDSIKITYNNIDFVKFKDTDFINKIMANRMATISVLGRLNLNHFAGKTTLQMFIEDYELEIPNKYDF